MQHAGPRVASVWVMYAKLRESQRLILRKSVTVRSEKLEVPEGETRVSPSPLWKCLYKWKIGTVHQLRALVGRPDGHR